MRLRIFVIAVAVTFISSVGFAADPKAPTKPTPPTKATVEKPAAKPEEKKAESKTELVDINTATKDQLKALEGIGDAYSKRLLMADPTQRKTS
jgi:competence protein ComEA